MRSARRTAQRSSRDPRLCHLGADRRGAILVLGLLLGALAVGILFHLVGVGHAIVWRELAQDAADNAAYEAAVWNARGMNVVVALNIFLAAVMAVLITWRLVMAFLAGVLIIAAVGCVFFPPACAVVATAGSILQSMTTHDPKVAGRVYRVIGMLHQGQKVVASATPILSLARSVRTTRARYDVDLAAGLGAQLLPTRSLAYAPKPEAPAARQRAQASPNEECGSLPPPRREVTLQDHSGLLGAPVSLPWVAEEDVPTLCDKGGRMRVYLLGSLADWLLYNLKGKDREVLRGITDPNSQWAALWGRVAGALSPYLCEDLQAAFKRLAHDAAGCVDDACRANAEAHADAARGTGYDSSSIGDTQAGGARRTSSEDLRWASLSSIAANGSLFMQSWGMARSERFDKDRLDDLLSVADTYGGRGTLHKVEDRGLVLAQAEMFYDCEGDWETCAPTAAWTLNWRARLRRVHDPLEMARAEAEKAIVATFWSMFGESAVASHIPGVSELQAHVARLGGRLVSANGRLVH